MYWNPRVGVIRSQRVRYTLSYSASTTLLEGRHVQILVLRDTGL